MLKSFINRILFSLSLRLMIIPRKIYHYFRARKIKDKDITLIANNCFGAQVLHDMNMKFNTPCVNLAFDLKDYVEFLSDLRSYLALNIEEVKDDKVPYPKGRFVGTNTNVKFMHYDSFEEAVNKWYQRRDRIIWDKIFVLMEIKELPLLNSDNSESVYMKRFLELPYRKAIVTAPSQKNREQYPESIIYEVPYFKDFSWGKALSWASNFSVKRNTDYFDYVSFFNQ